MTFPQTILDTRVELLLSGTWTDITSYVYQRDPIQITRGHPDESTSLNPTSCTMTIDNRTGRFSPRNPLGAYYGQLTRNTQMRLSLPEGSSYLRMEDDGTSYASCPNSAPLEITGDFELQIDAWLSDYTNSMLASRLSTAGGSSWNLSVLDTGYLQFSWATDSSGTAGWVLKSLLPLPLGRIAMKVTLAVATGTITFYTAPTIAGPWSQLGDSILVGPTIIYAGASPVTIGANADLAAAGSFNVSPTKGANGKIYAFKLLDGIGGTVVASPDFTAQAVGATSFTDAQSNTWALSGTAEISDRKYRACVEVPAWPPQWDPSGADVYAPIAGAGRWRRLTAGTPRANSAMYRTFVRQTGATAPVAYWPCEDGSSATSLASALGGPAMTFTGSPSLASDTGFLCSSPLPQMSGSQWTGIVPIYTAPTGAANVLRFLMMVPSSSPPPDGAIIASMYTYGTVARVDLLYRTDGQLELKGYDIRANVLFDDGPFAFGVLDQPLRMSIELQTSGSNVQYSFVTVAPGNDFGLVETGTTAGKIGNVYQVGVSLGSNLNATVIGHITVQAAWDSLFDTGPALNAWIGEYAATRLARLCAEENISSRIYGAPSGTTVMGAQTVQTIAALLQECEDADGGLIFEPRQVLGLGYRTRSSMYNQEPLALSYSNSQLSPPLEPVDDDRLIVNDMTVTRASGGSSARSVLETGTLSVQDPPNGVGSYSQQKTLNLAADSQLADEAGWLVHLGTVDDMRYPTLSLNLARTELADVYYQVQDVDTGDRVTVSDTPLWLSPDGIDQVVQGFTEVCYGYTFTEAWACAPASPLEVGILDDALMGRVDTDGSTLELTYPLGTETSIQVATTSAASPLWTTSTADFPFDIAVSGERMTVTGITGTMSPQTFTVTRSVNGVVKFQSAGADVRLWQPMILSI